MYAMAQSLRSGVDGTSLVRSLNPWEGRGLAGGGEKEKGGREREYRRMLPG